MTKEEVYQLVCQTSIYVDSRHKTLVRLARVKEAYIYLYEFMTNVEDKHHVMASVLFEELIRFDLLKMTSILDDFLMRLDTYANESTKRLISKIGRNIVYSKQLKLSKKQKQMLVDQALDWLVSDSKVATEAFAMDIIIRLKGEFAQEFTLAKGIVEKNYVSRSAAYQSKAKKLISA
ncbi:hypothetical protein VSO92_07065 [Myroides pelagicus]|uniref:hypothetical protein n=1 Tax=Myroides pelagicus TaxID=270914 RepID=UPI002DB84476|nr:hypothetical protein [Myroides pelagicus]MEC4113862.1 hypothetical protein [Myroides pelagicus]